MIEKIVETTIDRQRLIECGQNIGIGVSGGADSMVLLEVLYRLQQRRSCSFRLFVLHFEHGIRGEESVADMQFVRQYCAERGIPCIFEQRDVPAYAAQHGLNLEDAARRLRYDFFARCRRQHGLESQGPWLGSAAPHTRMLTPWAPSSCLTHVASLALSSPAETCAAGWGLPLRA